MKRLLTSIKLVALTGIFLFTVNAQWVEKDLGSLAWLRSIYFVDSETGWIVGSKGTIFKTSDSGDSWQRIEWKSSDLIRDVFFLNKDTGWILCERDQFSVGNNAASYVLQTADGGKTWSELESPDRSIRMLRFVYSKDRLGFIVGEKGTVWHYDSCQNKFETSNVGTQFMLTDGIYLSEASRLVVGGGGTILQTNDNGKTWEQRSFPGKNKVKLNSIVITGEGNMCSVGNRGTIICANKIGTMWSEIISGTTTDLFDIKADGRGKMIAVGDEGVILASDDNGKTWRNFTLKSKTRLERIGLQGDILFISGFGKLLRSQ